METAQLGFQDCFLTRQSIYKGRFLVPPPEFSNKGTVWKLKRPVSEFVSAPNAWFERLQEVLRDCGMSGCLSDEGIFGVFGKEGAVCGIIFIHVDDAMCGGTDNLHNLMGSVGEKLEVGSHDTATFLYKGLKVRTVYHGK